MTAERLRERARRSAEAPCRPPVSETNADRYGTCETLRRGWGLLRGARHFRFREDGFYGRPW